MESQHSKLGGHEIRQQEKSPVAGPPSPTSQLVHMEEVAQDGTNDQWGLSVVPRRLRPPAKHKYLGVERRCEERQKLNIIDQRHFTV